MLIFNICDFFPILKWAVYKGLEKNMIRMQKMRDEALGRLIEEMKQKKPHVEKKRTLIETLFSLRESEPKFYSDNVIKSIILVSSSTCFSLVKVIEIETCT